MCNSRDQNTLPVTNKANSNHLLSESKDLKFSQKLSLVFDFDTHFYSLGRQRKKKIFEPPFCGHIFWKAVSSVGTEPLKHFQFPAEGHCKVFIYLTDSLALLALFYVTQLTVGQNTFWKCILRQISQSFPLVRAFSAFYSSPLPLTCWQEAVNLFICVFCLCTLTVSCKAPLTACRERGMKEGFMERKRGCCCCLFSLSAPLEAWRSE